jgi:pilus assembly protein CpaB
VRRRLVPHRYDPLLALRRRPAHRGVLVAVLAAVCGILVARVVQAAEDTAAAWGERVPVLIASRDIDAGDRLDGGNTRVEHHPAPLVPDGALAELPDGRRLAAPAYAGELLRAERLAPSGRSVVAARLPEGTVAVAVPVEPGMAPPLVVGDLVDVLVALAPEAAGGGPPGFALATGAPVVDVGDTAVTVAVDEATAPRLAVAFGAGAVTLALTGG